MPIYIVYVGAGRDGKATTSFVVSNTRDAKSAKVAFRKDHPNMRIKTILKAQPAVWHGGRRRGK